MNLGTKVDWVLSSDGDGDGEARKYSIHRMERIFISHIISKPI